MCAGLRLGRLLRCVRAGEKSLVSQHPQVAVAPNSIHVDSPAFANGQPIPLRDTSSGEEIFPPLRWSHLPPQSRELVLIVEDADAPLPRPIVHVLVYGINVRSSGIEEGALPPHRDMAKGIRQHELAVGRNSFGTAAWLGPHPMAGHGVHRYFFQLFALDRSVSFAQPPNRKQMLRAIRGHVLARGVTVGTCSRAT